MAVAVEQLTSHGLDRHALLLDALGALDVVSVTGELDPPDPEPQRDQSEKQTGRNHQHPTPAHVPVGQLPSLDRRFTRDRRAVTSAVRWRGRSSPAKR